MNPGSRKPEVDMRFIFNLAARNILRQKRRTILTFLVFTFGIAMYITMVGMIEGYKLQSVENTIRFDSGHVKIRSPEYDAEEPYSLSNIIRSPGEVESVLRSKPYVTAFASRLLFQAEIGNGRDLSQCVVAAVDVSQDSRVFILTNYFVLGGFEEGGVVIGSTLSHDLGVEVGDYVTVYFRSSGGFLDAVDFMVSGIVNAPDPVVNNTMLYITMADAKKYVSAEGVTEISLKTQDYNRDKKYIADLSAALPGYQIFSWRKLSESIEAASLPDTISTYVFVIFIAIIALVGIINTMLMSVFEKIREIGTLKALGMTDREVRNLFVTEGAMIGIAGGIFGIILGALINAYFVYVGYDMAGMIGDTAQNMMANYRLANILYSVWNIPSFIWAFLVTLVTSILASYIPARKTSELQPAACLRTNQ